MNNIHLSTYVNMIKLIEKFNDDDFIKWYCSQILYSTDTLDEDKIFKIICKNKTNCKYFKLFSHFRCEGGTNNSNKYNNLLDIILTEKSYFVNKCKQILINELSNIITQYESEMAKN